ncbi:MAG TPA: hypothetical protein VFG10_10335 [Saprospiraceae bacterium]|nr:hypothetical protein [Saprospiraceae bacterium]
MQSTNTKALAIINLTDEWWYCKLTREQADCVIRSIRCSVFYAEGQDVH